MSQGTYRHIDESECFLPTGNLENFRSNRRKSKRSLLVCTMWLFMPIRHTGVEFCLFRFGHSRASSQISISSTLSFCIYAIRGAGWTIRTIFMSPSSILFQPWVGSDYPNGGIFHQKVLILGESHYCSSKPDNETCPCSLVGEECSSLTNDVVDDTLFCYNGERYQRTFVCFERAVYGKVPTQEERVALWNSVAFYNYFQFAQSGARRPIEQETSASESAFKEVLSTLKPDKVVVWGKRLYDILPDWGGKHSILDAEVDGTTDIWTYVVDGKEIPCLLVYHPSSPVGKNWTMWHSFYKKFLPL